VFDRVKTGALRKHPARENAFGLIVQQNLIHFDERGCLRRLGWRTHITNARRDFQRPENHSVVNRNFERGYAPRHLVERGENSRFVLEFLRACANRLKTDNHKCKAETKRHQLTIFHISWRFCRRRL